MTRAEEILLAAVEDCECILGLIEAVHRYGRDEPTADIILKYKNRANATLQVAWGLISSEANKEKR
jgi:hypothetical protein